MRTAPEMIRAAKAQKTNRPGMCQQNTWMLYESHSVGDVDGDNDADARDGWLSEPLHARHTDRRPKIGAPGYWSGGSGGFGHRANCTSYNAAGEPVFSSTDAGGRGIMADKPLSWFEDNWHLKWEGWSDTISGEPIKGLMNPPSKAKPVQPKPAAKKTRGTKMDQSLALAHQVKAKKGTTRARRVAAYVAAGEAVPFL